MLIVGQLRGFPLLASFERYVTKPWSSVEGWDYDAFICGDASTKVASGKLATLKITAEWSFSVDNVMSKLNKGVSKLPAYGHNYFFNSKYYHQHARVRECATRVLSYGSTHAKSYSWFVRMRPDMQLTQTLLHPVSFRCADCVYAGARLMLGLADRIT